MSGKPAHNSLSMKMMSSQLFIFVTRLHSYDLQISAKGAEHVADMLRYNNTISVLDLRANGLRDEVSADRFYQYSLFSLFCICTKYSFSKCI